jgi:hypothetical protein
MLSDSGPFTNIFLFNKQNPSAIISMLDSWSYRSIKTELAGREFSAVIKVYFNANATYRHAMFREMLSSMGNNALSRLLRLSRSKVSGGW